MFHNLSGWHVLVVLLVGLFVFGPDKLPAAVRDAARFLRAARGMLADASAAVREEVDPDLAADLAEFKDLAVPAGGHRASLARLLLDGDAVGPPSNVAPPRHLDRPGGGQVAATLRKSEPVTVTLPAAPMATGSAAWTTSDSPPVYLDAT
jgi:sec-independent protein translocase protein TatB